MITKRKLAFGMAAASVMSGPMAIALAQQASAGSATQTVCGSLGCTKNTIDCEIFYGSEAGCIATTEAISYGGVSLWAQAYLKGPGGADFPNNAHYCGLTRPCKDVASKAITSTGQWCSQGWTWKAGSNDQPQAFACVNFKF